jgi:hypothetical protein
MSPPRKKRAGKPDESTPGAINRSTLILVALWLVTGAIASAAHFMQPAANIRLEVTATTLGFTLAGESSQQLLRTTPVESLTIGGFRTIEPGTGGGSRAPASVITGEAGASMTATHADVEGIWAAGQALVRVNRPEDEPDTRITVAQRPASGTVRLPAQAAVTCYRCGDGSATAWLIRAPSEPREVSSFSWTGSADGGGTDLLLSTAGPLVLSEDDVRIEGSVETREASGQQMVSTVREGSLQFLDIPRTTPLTAGVRLTVARIQPGTGLLKRLEANPKGVTAVLEARVGSLSIEQAGQTTALLPSYLEIGFHNQRWLYLVQGFVLIGGTLSKVWRALFPGKEA